MRILFFISIICVCICSCTPTQQPGFEDIAGRMKAVALPFRYTGNTRLPHIQFAGVDTAIYQYLPASCGGQKMKVIGKIKAGSRYVALLLADSCAGTHLYYVTTFAKSGAPVTKFALYRLPYGSAQPYYSEAAFVITKDFINLSGSVSDHQTDSRGQMIKESLMMTSYDDTFMIANDGSIAEK